MKSTNEPNLERLRSDLRNNETRLIEIVDFYQTDGDVQDLIALLQFSDVRCSVLYILSELKVARLGALWKNVLPHVSTNEFEGAAGELSEASYYALDVVHSCASSSDYEALVHCLTHVDYSDENLFAKVFDLLLVKLVKYPEVKKKLFQECIVGNLSSAHAVGLTLFLEAKRPSHNFITYLFSLNVPQLNLYVFLTTAVYDRQNIELMSLLPPRVEKIFRIRDKMFTRLHGNTWEFWGQNT